MSTEDVANSTVVLVSVGLLLELEFYVAKTDKWLDTYAETFQCGYTVYKHSWNTVHPITHQFTLPDQ